MATKRQRPPASLTQSWDKAKWHNGDGRHVRQTLQFLEARGQLTAEGHRTLQDLDDAELSIVHEDVRSGARAFLDEYYDGYLVACSAGPEKALQALEAAWERYSETYDPSRRPLPTPFQQILLDVGVEDIHALLLTARRRPPLVAKLKEALPSVPEGDQPLVEAAVAAHEGRWEAVVAFPTNVAIKAARYARPSLERLLATSKLLEEIDYSVYEPTREIADAITFPGEPAVDSETANAACKLDKHSRDVLVSTARALMRRAHDEDKLIEAMAALATVGRKAEVELLEPFHQSTSATLKFAAREARRKLETRED